MSEIGDAIVITVPSSEFSKNFGRYREAAQREPVAVTSHDRVTGYFVSGSDYEAYMRMKAHMPKAYAVEELSEETIQAIAASKMDAKHDHLNSLLDD
jgi:PHD/YefM family antitoxin component YafN of YafNO toxin-antitoxin module